MGSCSSCLLADIRDNKVNPDTIHVGSKTEQDDSWDMSMDSDLYLERVTHIVADIHERVRHKHKSKDDRDTKDTDDSPPDIVTDSSDVSSNIASQSSSFFSSTNSNKKSNLSIPSIINTSSSNSLLP